MKERTPTVVGLAVLLLALAAVGAMVFGPNSDKLAVSSPKLGRNPGLGSGTSGSDTVHGTQPVTGTTIGGVGPTVVTTTTAPFVLAGPTGNAAASTTIPGPTPTFYSPGGGTPGGITAITSPTVADPRPFASPPHPTHNTPLCLAAFTVVSAFQVIQQMALQNPEAVAPISKFMVEQLTAAATALQGSSPPAGETAYVPPIVARLQATAAGYRDVGTVGEAVSGDIFNKRFATPKGPNETAGWPEVQIYLNAVCPEELSTLPH